MKYQDNQDMLNNAGPGGRPSTGAPPRRENRDSREPRDSMAPRQRTNTFNDSHQLFFGNVPHRATEDELREIFSKFGRIIDLRIHTKSQQKNPSARPLPNYGFITFDDQQSVQNCLNATVSVF
jgi:RNA recognition motif-containing protein